MSEQAWCTCTAQDIRIGCPIHDGLLEWADLYDRAVSHEEGAERAQSTIPVSHTGLCKCGHDKGWHTFVLKDIHHCVKCPCEAFDSWTNYLTGSALDEATNVANLALVYPDLMPETRAALAELVKVSRRLNEAVDKLVQGLEASSLSAE